MTYSADRHSRGLFISLWAGLASLLLHVVLLSDILFGTQAHVTRLADHPKVESQYLFDGEAMTVVALADPDEPAISPGSAGLISSALDSKKTLLVPVRRPHLIFATHINLPVDESSVATGSGETDPGRALLLGRYIGQISARVERAWIRPRTVIESDRFTCSARITQGSDGRVIEVELQNCNGDGRWQASLARAIQAASPLPAPPDQDVFARILTISFAAEQFAPGRDADGFEPESRMAMGLTPH